MSFRLAAAENILIIYGQVIKNGSEPCLISLPGWDLEVALLIDWNEPLYISLPQL